jgi:hypothetical protein
MMNVSDLWMSRLKVFGALLAIMLIAAGGACLAVWLTQKPIPEDASPAPMVRQADESVIAERAPDAHPLPPRHIIPKGAIEERREEIIVAPASPASSVEVDLSLVRQGNERRVIASSPDGTILKAVDIPIEPALIPPPALPWAAGLSYDTRHAVGVWLDRDVGRLVVGGSLARLPDGKAEAQIRVGVRF